MNPLITIITVTFNAAGVIEETINSVLQQSFTDYEYWVIDGGSNDGTQELVRKYGDRIKMVSEKDYGIYHAMNKGIEKSLGQWLYFLNAGDTIYNSDVLKNVFSENIEEGTELIYGNIRTKNHPSGSDYTQGQPITLKSFYYKIGLCHQAAFTHRKAFEAIGDYSYMQYMILADQEWFVRFLKADKKAQYMNQIIAYYEVVGESFLRRTQNYNDHLKIVANHFNTWVKFTNGLLSPIMKLKIIILKKVGGTSVYKFYRRLFFRD